MPQSLSRILIHTVYSTKDRLPFLLDPELRDETHAYLAGCAKSLDCLPVRIGGTENHVHLLTTLSRTVTVADFVKETKRNTTLWVKEKTGHQDFSWQAGYGCFSVSESQLPVVAKYIDKQEEHHRKAHFRTNTGSFCGFMAKAGMRNTSGIDSGTDATPLGLGYTGAEFPG